MQCPLCLDSVLEPRFHDGVEIDVCPTCKGVWLDRGELNKLADPSRESGHANGAVSTPAVERPAGKSKKKSKKKRKKGLGERLGDVLEDVLDFD